MKQITYFLSLITVFGLMETVMASPSFSINENYKLLIKDSPTPLTEADRTNIAQFVEATYQKLPEAIRTHLAPNRYPLTIQFTQIDQNQIVPLPECPVIEDMGPAEKIKTHFRDVTKKYGSNKIRYDGAIHTSVKWDDASGRYFILIHSGFIPSILASNSAVLAKTCDGSTVPQMAQASIVHGIVRAYDLTRFRSKAEADYIADPNGCGSLSDAKGSDSDRMYWDPASLDCYDLHQSKTIVSEKKRYRTISGGWGGKPGSYDKSSFAVWPRAVNTYAYAGDVQTHFAYHMEKFVLDPEFACRMPVIHEYLTEKFGDQYSAVNTGLCRVNTILRLTPIITLENGNRVVVLEEYDLDPKNVESIYYFRAGAGDDGISSAFGHSMFRVVARPGTEFARGGCAEEEDEQAKELGLNCDLVFNHRATSRELRLDNGRAAFGGYPSQMLVGSVYDILQEYGDSELRDVYNIPLGSMNNKRFVPMIEQDKTRFLHAGLEQYWSYLGKYKFITNNCADESMRLFSQASNHPGVQYAGVLTPSDINERVFEKLGFTDPKFMKGLRESGFFGRLLRKVAFWDGWVGGPQKRFERRRRAVESNEFVEASRKYSLYDGISALFEIENRILPSDKRKNPKDVKLLERELKSWVQLATVSEKPKDICKINEAYAASGDRLGIAEQKMQDFRSRYKRLMDPLIEKYNQNKSKVSQIKLKYDALLPSALEAQSRFEQKKITLKEFDEALVEIRAVKAELNPFESAVQQAFEDMAKLNHTFYLALYYADKKRQRAIGDLAVQIGYEIGLPDNDRPNLCKGELQWQVSQEKSKAVRDRIEDYRKLEMQLQPFSSVSVAKGYGIPLERELTSGNLFAILANAQLQRQQELILLLKGELGYDYELWFKIKQFRRDLCEERVRLSLFETEAPNCKVIFPEIYAAEELMRKNAEKLKK